MLHTGWRTLYTEERFTREKDGINGAIRFRAKSPIPFFSSTNTTSFTMKTQLVLLLSWPISMASGYTTVPKPSSSTAKIFHRRAFLSKIAGTIAATSGASLFSPNSASAAAPDTNLQNVYFGAGETIFVFNFPLKRL
jgi:hypothetical protein